jgi:hypothetical protein
LPPNANNRPQPAIRNSKASQTTQNLRFPIYDQGAHRILMVFNSYEYKPPGQRALNKLGFLGRSGITGPLPIEPKNKSFIELPLPVNIEDSYNIRVQGYDAEISGALAASAASQFAGAGDLSLGNIISAAGGALSGTGLDPSSLFSSDIGDISRNVAFLGRRNLPTNIGRAVDTGLGNTVNPKASLYFDGVNLKQFNFTWTLAPQDAAESDLIRDISNAIKRNILPSYGNAIGLTQSLLNYPSTVDLFFLGIDQQYFVYYKTCMAQSLNISYTPSGLAIVKGGKPAIITMNMNFIESDIHTAEDYDGSSTDNPVAAGSGVYRETGGYLDSQ